MKTLSELRKELNELENKEKEKTERKIIENKIKELKEKDTLKGKLKSAGSKVHSQLKETGKKFKEEKSGNSVFGGGQNILQNKTVSSEENCKHIYKENQYGLMKCIRCGIIKYN